jgi:hypothetical protein
MQFLQKRAHKQLIAADFLEPRVYRGERARAHGERHLRLEMSPISKHPNFKISGHPSFFNALLGLPRLRSAPTNKQVLPFKQCKT